MSSPPNGRRRGRRRVPDLDPAVPYSPDPLPPLQFPDALPVSAERERLVAAIRANRVVIVCGETGSGKTTQLPKICALAGGGTRGLIGHTQPRRLAATSVARRIAEELGSPLGRHVGFKVRFGETLSPGASIKLMTDGILLAETLGDPDLRRYDTLIVDEAHERSLNIDFLLGYLRRLLEGSRRDDLRVVITSATLDAERFSRHFASDGRPAPVIEVSGRTYPVEIRYRPLDGAPEGELDDGDGGDDASPAGEGRGGDGRATLARPAARGAAGRAPTRPDEDDETDLPSAIEAAIDELWRDRPGDVLVFLPGEREIREAADHLRRAASRGASRSLSAGPIEILPLYARLPAADQQRIFAPSGARRIVLATNVAETSLTVPGIRYVVDSGLARVKRYRIRGKVEQLQVEPVSRAAAAQRAGRCGRVADGICVRLYSERDFERRPAYTEPELLRSSLAAVILRMKALALDDVGAFPFVDPPSRRAVADGEAMLHELDALDADGRLTQTGRQLASLPIDPRIGRMLLEARRRGSLREVLVIAAGLASVDPRLRPPAARDAADTSHRRFVDDQSDFVGYLRLWDYWRDADTGRAARGETRRQSAARLEREFLSVRGLREWADVHAQLVQAVDELGWRAGEAPASYDAIHLAVLSGLLGNLGFRNADAKAYEGTHQVAFTIHPSSALARKPPRWLMAAELVDTGRLLARNVARIEPGWIESLGAHLLRRTWSEPFWSVASGQAMCHERATLYGLVVYAQRRVPVGARDPVSARRLLIRDALVDGQWPSNGVERRLDFIDANRRLVAEIEALEHRSRRPDLLADPAYLFDWFDARVPSEVWSVERLERWYRSRGEDGGGLRLSKEDLLRRTADAVDSDAYPRELAMRGCRFSLEYRFDPGSDDDGVTLMVPLAMLNQVDEGRCEWLVPGMRGALLDALLRTLPTKLRRHLMPLSDYASGFVARWAGREAERSLLGALCEDIRAQGGQLVRPSDFRLEALPTHLRMNFRVVDIHGARLGDARNLAELRARYGQHAQGAFQSALRSAAQRLARDTPEAPRPVAPVPAVPGNADGQLRPSAANASTRAGEGRGDVALTLVANAGARFADWSFGQLPEIMELHDPATGDTMIGYPALVDRGDCVELVVEDSAERARERHFDGVRRLFALALREPLRHFRRSVPDRQAMSLVYSGLAPGRHLEDDLAEAVVERACMAEPIPTDREGFDARVIQARTRLNLLGQELARLVGEILAEYHQVTRRRAALKAFPKAAADVETQLAELLPPAFIVAAPASQLAHFPRYLKALAHRIDALRADPARDERRLAEMAPLLAAWRRLRTQRRGARDVRLDEMRWLLEELRVSLFAQGLRTPMPVSVKRLQRVLDALQA